MRILLKNLIKSVREVRLLGRDDIVISGIEYDSRRVQPGMLFAAVPGFKSDGRKFIEQAIASGAVAVLSDSPVNLQIPVLVAASVRQALSDIAAAFYGFPGHQLESVGTTGTNGKSTSVAAIRHILEKAGKKTGMINSLTYDTGLRQYKADRTTPESLDMQRYLYEMKEAGCTHASLEVSSHALVLHRVENIDFKVGLYTNFSRDHLDFHNTMEEYLAAKKLFLKKLRGENKVVVINRDVPEYVAFIPDAECRVITYSAAGEKADILIHDANLTANHSTFELLMPSGTAKISTRLLGRYNLANMAGAAAAAFALGIPTATIAAALETLEPVPGRFRPIIAGQPFSILVDYAHTPDAIERLCLSAREITRGRLIILFGCGGDRDKGKRPIMGKAATRHSDFAVVTSDNPRTEDPMKIIEDILPGLNGDNYVVVPDRREAIRKVVKMAQPGDTILLAGKGAEDYQEIGAQKFPYDDTTEATAALAEIGFKG